jgi:hypothetical protein
MITEETLYLPPNGLELLIAITRQNLQWWKVFGEWIDNSLDAGATTVSISLIGKTEITITDDGRGCPNPGQMIRLGGHARHISTKLGRYGIGGKEAALWTGGIDSTIDISTIHNNRLHTLSLAWRYFGENWGAKVKTDDTPPSEERRTEIKIRPIDKTPPHGQDWKELLELLGYLYAPALKSGRQIKFKRSSRSEWEPLKRWELPAFQGEHIDTHINVNGRDVRVYCGIVKNGIPNPRCGFTYVHEWRVIEKSSAKGCGNYSPTRICGFVELDHSWPLNKNKDGVAKDADELYAAVEEAARPVLEQADKMGNELQSQVFDKNVNIALNQMLENRHAKAKRSSPINHPGTKNPTSKSSPHEKAKIEQIGSRFRRHTNNSWRVEYGSLGMTVGIGQVKEPNIVILNTDSLTVAHDKKHADLRAIVKLATGLILIHNQYYGAHGQKLVKEFYGDTPEDFSRTWASILDGPLSIDGESLARTIS